jgi:glucose/arabinose dehydrogenase
VQSRSRGSGSTVIVGALTVAATLLAGIRLPAQTLTDPSLTVTAVVTSGLSEPTTMAFLAPNDFLVLEKATGRVRRVLGGVLQPGFVLDVNVNSSSERGLLGIAINTESPPKVFLYYTEASGSDGGTAIANRVYRYDWNAGLGVLQNPLLVLDLPVTSGPNHDGGVLQLGPPGEGSVADGSLLYAVIGDLNRDGQLQNDSAGPAPDDTSVIFRVEQDGAAAAGNPFVPYCSVTTAQACPGGGGCPGGETCRTQVARYFAYGVRNSFGLALDPVTGDLWDTENGPGNYDEINRVLPGFNSGWNPIMGPDALDPQGIGNLFHMPGAGVTYSDPEFSWFDTNAPTAIVFPDGSTLGAAYDDVALVGDSNNGNLYRFLLNGSRDGFDFSALPDLQDLVADDVSEQNQARIGQGFGAITDLKIGPDGHLWVVSIFGDVYRISGGGPTHTSTPTGTPTPTRTPTPMNTATATATSTPPAPPACAPAPEVCGTPAIGDKALLLLKDDGDDTKDQLKWKWIKGAATDKTEFGNPVTTHGYELCIYAGGGLVASATAPAGVAWREKSTGFKFSDPSASSDGMRTIVLKAGPDEKAKIIVRGKGTDLDMPNLAALASPLTVQLKRAGGTVCWGATYTFPPALKNTSELFKDKAD